MEILAKINAVIFLMVGGLRISIGLDLKKWHSWLLGTYAFSTFFLVGLTGPNASIDEALHMGTLFTFVTIFGGGIIYLIRERSKKWLQEHEKKAERISTKKPH